MYVSALNLVIEEGDSQTYVVALTSLPTGDVTIGFRSQNDDNNKNTIIASVRPSARELEFTTENWYMPQTMTVLSYHDPDLLDHTATVSHSVTGADYENNNVAGPTVAVTIQDDSSAYLFFDGPSVVDENIGTFFVTVTSILYSKFPPRDDARHYYSAPIPFT